MTTHVHDVPRLPARPRDAHKGTFGNVLVVAGSVGMAGAAVLAGSAALRGGAGLVRVAVPEPILPTVAAAQPCYVTAALPADGQGRVSSAAVPVLLALAETADAVVLGPGLGGGPDVAVVVREMLGCSRLPLVLDADALNSLAGRTSPLRDHKGPRVLTPHPGEFARLTGRDVASVQRDRVALASAFALGHGGVLLLKGADTVVTDGARVYVNATGNPGMATGGVGDVLSGLLGALLAAGVAAFDAAVLGAHLHGLAGDRARDRKGETALIATDVLDHLADAFVAHQAKG